MDDNGRPLPVDTGFIVYNPVTYPGLIRLFDELGVPTKASQMSFSVSDTRTGLEYGSATLDSFFAQRRNVFNPRFWGLIRSFLRFRQEGRAAITDPAYARYTLGQWLAEKHYGWLFVRDFMIPATSAIWSSPLKVVHDFPLQYLLGFYQNHGLFDPHRVRWQTVVGGSRIYVEKITAGFRDRIQVRNGALAIRRQADGIRVKLADGSESEFDQVVLATHSDQALRLLADATPAEREILGALLYQPNDVVFHTDTNLLPRRRRAWASWNYRVYSPGDDQPVSMTYWMNSLQGLETEADYCVTVNANEPIREDRVIRHFVYDHPLYSFTSLAAQKRLPEINGLNRTHFCGAWCGYGFHEDGLQAAVKVAANLGVSW